MKSINEYNLIIANAVSVTAHHHTERSTKQHIMPVLSRNSHRACDEDLQDLANSIIIHALQSDISCLAGSPPSIPSGPKRSSSALFFSDLFQGCCFKQSRHSTAHTQERKLTHAKSPALSALVGILKQAHSDTAACRRYVAVASTALLQTLSSRASQ